MLARSNGAAGLRLLVGVGVVERDLALVGSVFFFSSRRRHTRFDCDWSSDVCSSDLWWSAYLFTTVSDMFPPGAVGSVVGIGGCAGLFSAFGLQRLTGTILQVTGGNYEIGRASGRGRG